MTIQELKKWQTSQELEDVWWIQIDGETLGRKVNLEKAGQILNQKLDSEVMVLHVSRTSQRPRPWIEVERAKTARSRIEVERVQTVFVKKPHDNEFDGEKTIDTSSGEREPRPAQIFDFDSSQGSFDQTPVSEPILPPDLPPRPVRTSFTGKLDPSNKKVSFKCTQCGRVAKYSSDEFPFRVRCRSCESTHSVEKVEVSSWQFFKVFFGHLLLLSLPALFWAFLKDRTAEAEAAKTVARMFGKDAHYLSTTFIGTLIAYIIIYSILTFWVSLIFFNQGLKHYNLSRFDGFKSCIIKYGGWVCVIFFVLAIAANIYIGKTI
ncbi:hypothetical protein N9C66_08790 [Akkermansiaceae bacterium]|nr:hypothetical protein [Akkermansiaceae bacterium]